MSEYRCTATRRIADDVYVEGETYHISDELGTRYAAYFEAVGATGQAATSAAATGTTAAPTRIVRRAT